MFLRFGWDAFYMTENSLHGTGVAVDVPANSAVKVTFTDVNSLYPSPYTFTCARRCTINGESLRCTNPELHPEIGEHYGVASDGRTFTWVSRHQYKHRETSDYLSFARRVIRAAGRRCADADEVELRELIELVEVEGKAAIQAAVDGMRARGESWAYIARATGGTREAAFQKWGKK